MKITVQNPHLRAIMAVAPRQDVRGYLNGVFVDHVNDFLVATDGHRLIRVPCEIEGAIPKDLAGIDLILGLPRVAPKVTYDESVSIEVSYFVPDEDNPDEFGATPNWSGSVWKYTDKHGGVITHQTVTRDGKFPDYQRVEARTGECKKTTQIGFNPDYLSDVSKALKAVGVQLFLHGSAGSIAIKFAVKYGGNDDGYADVHYTVMPMRV